MQLPEAFITKYQALLGDEAPAFFATFNQPAESGFRINPLKPQPVALNTDQPIAYSEWGFVGKVDGNGIDHTSGLVYSQEPSAQFVGTVAAPKPGELVLDLCAAPGGKTTHLASYMQDEGLLISNEINAGRAKILSSNVERFGLTHTVVTNSDPATLAKLWPETFDRILVDAPCSGEGMFRKDPEAIRYWNADYPAQCATRQREILTEAVKMLKPGGTLVYSTCTFSPEEDEQMIAWLVDTYGLTIEPIKKFEGMVDGHPEWANGNPDLSKTARLFPHRIMGEGHFVAKLTKSGSTDTTSHFQRTKPTAAQQRDFDTFWTDTFTTALNQPLHVVKDQLYALPSQTPDLGHIHVLRFGLHLGTFKKNRFEPSHSLATALPASWFKAVEALDADQYLRYRHGETVTSSLPGKRYVLLTNEDKGFALGKLVNGTIKNHYPKGLRV